MQESDAIGREVVEGARVTRWTFGTRTADDDWLHARDRSRGGVDRGETAAIRCRDEGPALHSTQHAINHDGPLRRLRGILLSQELLQLPYLRCIGFRVYPELPRMRLFAWI